MLDLKVGRIIAVGKKNNGFVGFMWEKNNNFLAFKQR